MAADRPVDRDIRPPRLGGPSARLGRYAVLGGHGKLGNPYAADGGIENSPLAGALQGGDVLAEQAPLVEAPDTTELPISSDASAGGDGAPGSGDGGGDGGGESSGDF